MPKGAKIIPYLTTENLKNHTLSRGTYLYGPGDSPYMGVPPLRGSPLLVVYEPSQMVDTYFVAHYIWHIHHLLNDRLYNVNKLWNIA